MVLRQQIQRELSQAGFTDIRVMPESFLVRAKDSAGNPVMMVINPNSITAVTGIPGQQNRTAQNSGYNGVQNGRNGPMGSSAMGNSGQSGNAINSPNGNGTMVR